jgi:hypothetical protein
MRCDAVITFHSRGDNVKLYLACLYNMIDMYNSENYYVYSIESGERMQIEAVNS